MEERDSEVTKIEDLTVRNAQAIRVVRESLDRLEAHVLLQALDAEKTPNSSEPGRA